MTASGRQPLLASRSFLAHPLVSDFCAEQAQGPEQHEAAPRQPNSLSRKREKAATVPACSRQPRVNPDEQ